MFFNFVFNENINGKYIIDDNLSETDVKKNLDCFHVFLVSIFLKLCYFYPLWFDYSGRPMILKRHRFENLSHFNVKTLIAFHLF